MRVAVADALLRPELAEPGRTPSGRFKVSHLFRSDPGDGPQAYVVESESEHAKVDTHFHVVEQFQVFLGGDGSFQRHQIQPVSVHYTDRYSTYGPIVAGDDGLTFAVLRETFDPGANYMPGSRDKLTGSPGRNVEIPTAGTERDAVLLDEDDGLRVEVQELEPSAPRQVLDADLGRGTYGMILSGEARIDDVNAEEGRAHEAMGPHGGQVLGPRSCFFVGSGEPPVVLWAGPAGCRLLIMGFPRPADDAPASVRAVAGQGHA